MRTTAHPIRGAARRFLLGRGPLKRGTDRAEVASRLLLLVAVIAAVPLGFLAAAVMWTQLSAVAAGQAAQRTPVAAVVLTTPKQEGQQTWSEYPQAGSVEAPVAWTATDGHTRTAVSTVPGTAGPGDRVRIWLSPGGTITTPPLERREIRNGAVCTGVLAAMGVPVIASSLHLLVCALLNLRRSRQWEADWSAAEPVWSARGGWSPA